MPPRQAPDQSGVLQGSGAHDHPGQSQLEQGLGREVVTDPAAVLNGDTDGLHDGGDDLAVGRPAGTCRVEVHDVQPRGARARELTGDRDGVTPVDGLAGVVALHQTDATSLPEVYGGIEVQRRRQPRPPSPGSHRTSPHTSAKLRSSPRPVPPDFSGWNWVAQTLPRSTAATTGPP